MPNKKINLSFQNESIWKSKEGDIIIYKDGFKKILEWNEYQNIMN
jgi:hypothetical protein